MTGVTQSETGDARAAWRRGSGVRALLDAILCLYIAVILFRTFEVEGYIISTGSMAPSLLGFHKRVVCPSCGFPFAFGIAVDASGTAADTTGSESTRDSNHRGGEVRCPNCGQDSIDAGIVPPNYGDQLLVQKNLYEFRRPRRWEVVVLKSPARPTPPFVKRIVGLPNESVQIIDGDIYADGKICRKDLDEQRALRIPVFDNDYVPDDPPEERGGWVVEPSRTPWQVQGHAFAVTSPATASAPSSAASSAASSAPGGADGEISWLAFRRWVRRGGTYKTDVPLAAAASDVHLPRTAFPQLRFDSARGRLACTGALAGSERDRLLATNADSKVRTAIAELYERSHEGPITDEYGYNRADSGLVPLAVRDIMLECSVTFDSDAGQVMFEVGDGRQTYRLTIDRSQKEARLTAANRDELLRSAAVPQDLARRPAKIELSIFDRQVIAALDGAPLFPAWECETGRTEPPRRPLRIGARGATLRVSALKVFRDIHYTRGQGRNGVDRPIRLAADEYFVLGDNSPVSNDGRSWTEGAVRESQLIGKPLVVHLPSRPGEFTLGGHTRYIRIPDFHRMRYIR
jgi:signal peptidase I